ncbi:MAG: DUF202 domain-containing protein [Ichthyobacteriaceae bacterium]|nr:DUF202 domain-containing protein [Ichthyobacteriaceae bacterium]
MKELPIQERLNIERTKLANERTFLAYFRTGVGFMGAGLTIIKINMFQQIEYFGEGLVIMGPLFLLIGVYRRWRVCKRMNSYYSDKNKVC